MTTVLDPSAFADLIDLASERARRRGHRGERRVLRAEGEPPQGGAAGLPGGRVHGPREVDGRLGDAPPARAGPRLVRRPPRTPGRRPRGRRRHAATSSATAPEACSSRRATAAARGLGRGARARAPGPRSSRRSLLAPDFENAFPALAGRRATHARARTSIPTAAWRGCGSTAPWFPTGTRSRGEAEIDLAAAENGGLVVGRERHVLRQPPATSSSRAAARHAGRLGDAAAPRPRARLGHRAAGARGRRAADRGRHDSISRETRPARARSRSHARRTPSIGGAHERVRAVARDPAAHARCSPTRCTSFEARGPRRRRRDARAPQHLSGRRRRAAAPLRNARAGAGVTAGDRTPERARTGGGRGGAPRLLRLAAWARRMAEERPFRDLEHLREARGARLAGAVARGLARGVRAPTRGSATRRRRAAPRASRSRARSAPAEVARGARRGRTGATRRDSATCFSSARPERARRRCSSALNGALPNDRQTEHRVAAAEQRRSRACGWEAAFGQ